MLCLQMAHFWSTLSIHLWHQIHYFPMKRGRFEANIKMSLGVISQNRSKTLMPITERIFRL